MNIIIIIKHGPHDMSWFISRAPAHHLGGSDGKADHAACAFEINRSDAQILPQEEDEVRAGGGTAREEGDRQEGDRPHVPPPN